MMRILDEYKAIIEGFSCPEDIQSFLTYGDWTVITEYRQKLSELLDKNLLDDTEMGWLQDIDALFATKLSGTQLAELQACAPGMPVRQWWGG